jgi:hypothetical protein
MATARNFEVISKQFDELSGSVKAVGPGFSAIWSIMRHSNYYNYSTTCLQHRVTMKVEFVFLATPYI